jgi:hypothetical protein
MGVSDQMRQAVGMMSNLDTNVGKVNRAVEDGMSAVAKTYAIDHPMPHCPPTTLIYPVTEIAFLLYLLRFIRNPQFR